ncbi:hypothetical protein C6P44_002758 [Monosporozyma unispora]|nr:hypothetical protein C6P44_002758 [Kazachstania unispora]
MSQLSVSYGILNDKSWKSNNNNTNSITHILPITKIISLTNFYLTISRDGSIIWHDLLNPLKNLKLQIHSDWISDILYLYSLDNDHHNYFISVSHDFSINLIHIYSTLTNDWKWDSKIIGYHQDYIKCISKLNGNTFVTTGLDSFINIWSIENDETYLLKTFAHPEGSLYTLQCLENSPYPFDIIVGDCNGNIIFYHSLKDQPIYNIPAHTTNIKCIKLFDNNTKLLSTCSNGVVKIWDLTQPQTISLLSSFHWGNNAVIWSIERDNNNSLLISDSKGYISTLKYLPHDNTPQIDTLFHDPNHKRHPGLLAAIRQDNILKFAYCSNSNLNNFNLSTGELIIEEGGIALTRSSLLTNRRHVITENTKGVIQRWDIVSCELINTFDQKEGTFDDLVVKYTSHEILSHWCTVSIKVGILFVKIGPKFTNTEIYGNALKEYDLLNAQNKDDKKKNDKKQNKKKHHHHHHNKHPSESDDENVTGETEREENSMINDEYRYNLGKVVINSLFNEFMKWEINQDDKFRHRLISDVDNNNTNNNSNSNISYINSPPTQSKHKKKSTFANLSISTSHFKTKEVSENNTPYVSAPSTPVGELNNATSNLNRMNMGHKSHEDLLHTALMDSTTLQQPEPKTNSSRTLSSGSLFTRKFRAFRNSSKSTNNKDGTITPVSSTPLSNSTNLERPHTTNGTPVNIDSQIDFNNNIFKTSNNSHNSLPESSQRNSMSSPSLPLTSQQPLNTNLTPVSVPAPPPQTRANETVRRDSKSFMSDLINEVHESYIDQLQNQSSLAKLSLTKRKVDSQIKRDHDLPIVKINSKTLLLVQSWNEGTCGGKVLFSTVLPMSVPMYSPSLQNNLSSTSLISTISSISSLDSSLDTTSISSKNSNNSSTSSTTISTHGKLLNKKIHHENKKLFTKIERNLPYWIGEILCKDDNVVQEKQPKLHFIIVPWVPEDQQDSIGDALPQVPSHHHHHHTGFKLGKSKSNDLIKSSMTDLPKIAETNTKLVAPGMIKVKKIKNYVVDRFETKTPEMKEKLEPCAWIELLCKGQVLDNDMTLSTVRTLFWKAQGEITINYRRKVPI